MTDTDLFRAIHAALLKQAHDLQEQRAAVLQQAAAIEQRFGFKRNATLKVEIRQGDNVASAVVYQQRDE